MNNVNRRTFLGATTAAGLGALGNTSASAGESDRLRVGVMGVGGRGTSLMQTFQRQARVDVTYVCDVDQARANAAAATMQKLTEQPAPRAVTDYRRILDDRNVDILVVATCNHWHAPAAILGMAAGKHIYVEKPCSHNPREGELMVMAAQKHNKKVQMGNQRRTYAKVIEAMGLVRSGEAIGRAYFAEAWYMNNRPTIGRAKAGDPPQGLDWELWQGPAARRPYHSNYLHYNWHWFWHWGNGELGNNGIHTLDLCRWGLGVDFPVRVTSSGGRYRFEDDQETPDTHVVNYEFDGRKQIMWEGLSCSRQPNRPYLALFHGERGTLALSDRNYVISDPAGKEVRTEPVQGNDAGHVANLIAAIRDGTPLSSGIVEAHKSTLLCHLGNIAHRTGRAIRCNPRDGHIVDDKPAMEMWSREYAKGFEPQV